MLTFYDYLPSQNAWKVRQLMSLLAIPHETKLVRIFDGEGQTDAYRRINPWGAVPALAFSDGRVLSESNAILFYLARGTTYLPDDPFAQAKVQQWLSFEGDYVQSTIGSLRYWTLTGKLASRPTEMVEARRKLSEQALAVLDQELAERPFILPEGFTIADIALFAYAAHAEEAGISLADYPAFKAWVDRVSRQPGFLAERYGYDVDPSAWRELP